MSLSDRPPMLEIERSAETLRVSSDRFELAFRYSVDRWLHELSWREADHMQTLLRSIEGGSEDLVPPNPALQDLRLERLSDQVVEFQGMGQAGSAIYSAAIRCDVAAGEISFDLCVRGKRTDSSIQAQSLYGMSQLSAKPAQIDGSVIVAVSEVKLVVAPIRIDGQPESACRLVEQNGTQCVAAGCFAASTSVAGTRPRSLRWGYRFTLDGLP